MSKTVSKSVAALFTLVIGTAEPAEAQRSVSPFCEAVNQHGTRSWQAFAAYDGLQHGGVNLYSMAPDTRLNEIDHMTASYPEATRRVVRSQILSRMEAFDRAADPQKLIMLTRELLGHGISLTDIDFNAAQCDPG